jgi:hypothetical protein
VDAFAQLIRDFVWFFISFLPWAVRVRRTHRGLAFKHRFRWRLWPRWAYRLLPWWLGKRFVAWVPFARTSKSWCCTQVLNPGVHFYWPKLTEIDILPTVRQTENLLEQSLTTSDGISITCSATVIYRVPDINLALCKTWDFSSTIRDIAQLAVVEVITTKTLEETLQGMQEKTLAKELTRRVRANLRGYGVFVMEAFFAEETRATAHRLFGGSAVPIAEEEE